MQVCKIKYSANSAWYSDYVGSFVVVESLGYDFSGNPIYYVDPNDKSYYISKKNCGALFYVDDDKTELNCIKILRIKGGEVIKNYCDDEETNSEKVESIGIKYDSDKLDWSLMPIEPLEEVLKVLMFGAKKYKRGNWKLVDDHKRRYYNAAMRHLTALAKGEEVDPETNISHLAHAICCLLFLLDRKDEK